MTKDKLQDKCRGSLIGGAVGDALGYEVEFMSLSAILRQFGESGITRYVTHNGVAEFSDDTQMTLFTAEGILSAYANGKLDEAEIRSQIRKSYEHWYATQTRVPYALSRNWLSNLATLWSERAPGMTCMSALHQIAYGDGSPVENNSKGCGGVMRVAPIGIFSAAHPDIVDTCMAGRLAGLAAEITHKHPLSTMSSKALAIIVAKCIAMDEVNRVPFKALVIENVLNAMEIEYANNESFEYLRSLLLNAIDLAESDNVSDHEAIKILGQGWVAEETLAIAIFSVMRYIDDFEKCIVCSVNHDGDSDSTGAVAGNIIGAIIGYSAIPGHYIENLEIEPVLVSVADDLCADVSILKVNLRVGDRYVKHLPVGVDSNFLIQQNNNLQMEKEKTHGRDVG